MPSVWHDTVRCHALQHDIVQHGMPCRDMTQTTETPSRRVLWWTHPARVIVLPRGNNTMPSGTHMVCLLGTQISLLRLALLRFAGTTLPYNTWPCAPFQGVASHCFLHVEYNGRIIT